MADTRFVEIYRAENDIAAHLVKGTLEAAGIPTQITEESFAANRGLNPIWWASPRILVAESQAEEAAAIIREIEAARATRKTSGSKD
ncbi:MAG TPA: DUF2007 domain-containing protein [Planctomycetaceae bacterium]|jgi:hypothetical protein|nr:DUF2007 domain-containing protein [Planctomycetaceae bacterium]